MVLRAPFGDRRLSNRGERIDLRDRNGGLIDRVDYRDRGVWPRQADGEGASLALREFELGSDPWAESRPLLDLVRNATGGLTLIASEGPPPIRLEHGFPRQNPGPIAGTRVEIDTSAPSQVFRLVLPDSSVVPLEKRP